MAKHQVFISYRTKTDGYAAENIRQHLEKALGSDAVYMDVHSMPLGQDFRKKLEEAVGACAVLLAIIGNNFEGVDAETGERSIDRENDYVRIEIETALKRDVPVIPVLIGDARIPKKGALPPTLEPLRYRNATEVRSGRYMTDHLNRLVGELRTILQTGPGETTDSDKTGTGRSDNGGLRNGTKLILLVAALAVGVGGGWAYFKLAPQNANAVTPVASMPWSASTGKTRSGMSIEVTHPSNWLAKVSTPGAAPLEYNSVAITADPGGLTLELPNQSGLFVFGLDSIGTNTALDAFIARKLTSIAGGTLKYLPSTQIDERVFQADLQLQNGSPIGRMFLAKTEQGSATFVLWRVFLGDVPSNSVAIQIAIDSLRVMSGN